MVKLIHDFRLCEIAVIIYLAPRAGESSWGIETCNWEPKEQGVTCSLVFHLEIYPVYAILFRVMQLGANKETLRMKPVDLLHTIRESIEHDLEADDQQLARLEEYAWALGLCKDGVEAKRVKYAQALKRIRETDQLYNSSEQVRTPPPWEDLPDEE
jgi:hypothetical protein